MKHRVNLIILLISSIILFFGCGGGGGSGGSDGVSTGTVSINITDAKPMLPAGTENVWVTFSEVLVHKSGGSWTSLPLAQTPYTIDLLQFHSGNKTQLVPPSSLETGTYTQIRIVVDNATIRIDDGVSVTDHPAEVPSGKLKTDKNFYFVVQGGGAVDITIDFDLSKSIVMSGPAAVPSFKMKPVLHINETKEAATIHGQIANATFISNNSNKSIITVIWDKDLSGNLSPSDEVYTSVEVVKGNPADFSIFWLVPLEGYIVEIDMGGSSSPGPEFQDFVQPADLQPGDVFDLNSGVPY